MELMGAALLGAILSVTVQIVKKYSPSSLVTRLAVIGASIALAIAYQALSRFGLLDLTVTILGSASAVYVIIIKPFTDLK